MDSGTVDMYLPDIWSDTGNNNEGDDHITVTSYPIIPVIEVDRFSVVVSTEITSEQHEDQHIQVVVFIGWTSNCLRHGLLGTNGDPRSCQVT